MVLIYNTTLANEKLVFKVYAFISLSLGRFYSIYAIPKKFSYYKMIVLLTLEPPSILAIVASWIWNC